MANDISVTSGLEHSPNVQSVAGRFVSGRPTLAPAGQGTAARGDFAENARPAPGDATELESRSRSAKPATSRSARSMPGRRCSMCRLKSYWWSPMPRSPFPS